MLYGTRLLPGKTVPVTAEDGGEILHISQMCLVDPAEPSKTYVQVHVGTKVYCVAVLRKDVCEQASVDLFVSTSSDVSLSTRGGKNEVHVVGYFEPSNESDDDECDDAALEQMMKRRRKALGDDDDSDLIDDEAEEDDDDEDDDDDDEEEEEEEEEEEDGRLDAKMTNGKMHPRIQEIENDDEDEDEENDDEDDEDDEEEGSDKQESAGDKQAAKKKQLSAKNKQQTNRVDQSATKRKAESTKGNDSDKKVKGGSSGATSFQVELQKFLTSNGRTNLGILGSKVKKPADISEKLGQFLKDRPTMFTVENGFVSLAK